MIVRNACRNQDICTKASPLMFVALIDNWHYFLIANWHDLVLVQGIKKEVRSRLCGSFTRRAS